MYHRTTLSSYIFATARIDNRKNLLNSNISSTCPYNMVNFGPLRLRSVSGVCGTPANFNGFRVLASLLQRHRSPEAIQTARCLAVSWLVHLFIFGGSCPLTEFCQVQNSLCVQVLPSPILAALLHGTPAAGLSQTLRRGTRKWNYGTFADGAPYIPLGCHDVGHRPTFYLIINFDNIERTS